MARQSQQFKDFTAGIQSDRYEFANGLGFIAGASVTEIPGSIVPTRRMDAMTESASTNDITDDVTSIIKYTGDSNYSLYAKGASDERIYGLNSTPAWTLVHTDANAGTDGQPLIVFGANMYWVSNTKLGKYEGSTTTWTDSFKSLKETSSNNNPAVVFAGKLYVATARYIATLDGDGTTWDDDALTLPLGSYIVDMRVWNDSLAIVTSLNGKTKLFIWDGTSDTYNEDFTIEELGVQWAFNFYNHLLLFFGNGKIYEYNGASINHIKSVTKYYPTSGYISYPGAVAIHDGDLLFALKTNHQIVNAYCGTYSLSRYDSSYPLALSLYSYTSNRLASNDFHTALYSDGQGTLYAAWAIYSGDAGIDKTSSNYRWTSYTVGPVYKAMSFVDTINHSLNEGSEMAVIGITLESNDPFTGNSNGTSSTIEVFTDPEDSGTWTSQGIIYNYNQQRTIWFNTPINCKFIKFRFAFSSADANNYANMSGYIPHFIPRGPAYLVN